MDGLLPEGVHPGRLRVARQGVDDRDDLLGQTALGDERQGLGRVVVGPQAGLVDAEQGERLVDDVAEQAIEILTPAHLCGDPAQRIGTRREIGRR